MPPELEARRNEILKERDLLKSRVFDLKVSWDESYSIQVDSVVEILELDAVKDMMESTRERDGNNKILEYLQTNHNV